MNIKLYVTSLAFVLLTQLCATAQERKICVDGTCFNVLMKGFEHRKANAPVIVLENGLGVDIPFWGSLVDSLAVSAAVFAYDRAGVGKSDKRFSIPTPQSIALDLRNILSALKITPPYLLVGHSLGGVLIRAYAGYYPAEVSGLVFIDPADFLETNNDWRQLMVDVGVNEARVKEIMAPRLNPVAGPVDSVRYGPWSEALMLARLRQYDFKELNALPMPQVPILFLVGGKFDVPKERWSKDFDHPKFFVEKTSRNVKRWNNFIYTSKEGGSLVYLTNCGHFVHHDDPVATVMNIRLMLKK